MYFVLPNCTCIASGVCAAASAFTVCTWSRGGGASGSTSAHDVSALDDLRKPMLLAGDCGTPTCDDADGEKTRANDVALGTKCTLAVKDEGVAAVPGRTNDDDGDEDKGDAGMLEEAEASAAWSAGVVALRTRGGVWCTLRCTSGGGGVCRGACGDVIPVDIEAAVAPLLPVTDVPTTIDFGTAGLTKPAPAAHTFPLSIPQVSTVDVEVSGN